MRSSKVPGLKALLTLKARTRNFWPEWASEIPEWPLDVGGMTRLERHCRFEKGQLSVAYARGRGASVIIAQTSRCLLVFSTSARVCDTSVSHDGPSTDMRRASIRACRRMPLRYAQSRCVPCIIG
jgi:hypothetical protein